MKNEDVESMLENMKMPEPEKLMQHRELKIPLLSYKKSSRAGLWLLVVPFIFAITVVIKSEFHVQAGYLDFMRKFFAAIDNNAVLTYLIPLIFIGLPLLAMVINFLAICHFQNNNRTKELIITIKHRPINIVIFLVAFAVLIFYLLPDKLSF